MIFIYDVEIDDAHRGKGYGRAAMELAEEQARAQGIGASSSTSSAATVARKLYLSLGYVETSVQMAKDEA